MYYHTTEAREIPRLRACTHSIPDAFLSHVYKVRFAIYGRRSSPIATSKAVHFGRQCESESQACVRRRFSSREGGTRSMGDCPRRIPRCSWIPSDILSDDYSLRNREAGACILKLKSSLFICNTTFVRHEPNEFRVDQSGAALGKK